MLLLSILSLSPSTPLGDISPEHTAPPSPQAGLLTQSASHQRGNLHFTGDLSSDGRRRGIWLSGPRGDIWRPAEMWSCLPQVSWGRKGQILPDSVCSFGQWHFSHIGDERICAVPKITTSFSWKDFLHFCWVLAWAVWQMTAASINHCWARLVFNMHVCACSECPNEWMKRKKKKKEEPTSRGSRYVGGEGGEKRT